MTATLKPGPLAGQDLSLLVAGKSVLLAVETTCNFCAGETVIYEGPGPMGEVMVNGMSWATSRFTYLGIDRSSDLGAGWIGWPGGENVLGDRRVEVRLRSGAVLTDIASNPEWSVPAFGPDIGLGDIVAFRLLADADGSFGQGWSVHNPNGMVDPVVAALRHENNPCYYIAKDYEPPLIPAKPEPTAAGKEPGQVALEPTPEQLEPFARKWCVANGIDPDEPEPPHGEWPRWYGACGPFAEMWRDISRAVLSAYAQPEGARANQIGFHSFDPDDRFYHASDRTWWRKETGGRLVSTEPPPYAQPDQSQRVRELEAALREVAALPNLSDDPKDDFDRGARAARLDASDIAKAALAQPTGET